MDVFKCYYSRKVKWFWLWHTFRDCKTQQLWWDSSMRWRHCRQPTCWFGLIYSQGHLDNNTAQPREKIMGYSFLSKVGLSGRCFKHETNENTSIPPWMGCQSVASYFPRYCWYTHLYSRVSCSRTQAHRSQWGFEPTFWHLGHQSPIPMCCTGQPWPRVIFMKTTHRCVSKNLVFRGQLLRAEQTAYQTKTDFFGYQPNLHTKCMHFGW